jgi:cell division septum initiation protein DivIVA
VVHPTLSKVYPMADVGQAALDVHHNLHQGKVGVLTLAPEEGPGVRDHGKRERRLAAINRFRGVEDGGSTATPRPPAGTLVPDDTRKAAPHSARMERMTDPRRDQLTGHEAQHSFDVVLRGYDRHQVAETIERLEADFRIAIADRDAAVGRSADLASQLSAMHGEIESLRRKAATANAPTFENISERIQHMLQLAEEEAEEIRRAAETEAHAVREHVAGEERAMLERQAAGQAEVERMITEARQAAEQIHQRAQLRADELVSKAQERVARLDAESQARRAKVEEDFEIAQRARRAEAAHQDEERERISTEAARQRIGAAERHVAQMIADAEAKAEAIRDVRDELTGRLLQARQLLATLPDLADRPMDRDEGQAGQRAAERSAAPVGTPTTSGPSAPASRAPAPAAGPTPSMPAAPQRQDPVTTQFLAPANAQRTEMQRTETQRTEQAQRTEQSPGTGRLPMPPRQATGSGAVQSTSPGTASGTPPIAAVPARSGGASASTADTSAPAHATEEPATGEPAVGEQATGEPAGDRSTEPTADSTTTRTPARPSPTPRPQGPTTQAIDQPVQARG